MKKKSKTNNEKAKINYFQKNIDSHMSLSGKIGKNEKIPENSATNIHAIFNAHILSGRIEFLQIFLKMGATHLSLVTAQLANLPELGLAKEKKKRKKMQTEIATEQNRENRSNNLLKKFHMVLLGGGAISSFHWDEVVSNKSSKAFFLQNYFHGYNLLPTYGMSESFAQLATWRPWLSKGSYALLPGRKIFIEEKNLYLPVLPANGSRKNSATKAAEIGWGYFAGYYQHGVVQCEQANLKKNGDNNIYFNTSDLVEPRRYTMRENLYWLCSVAYYFCLKAINTVLRVSEKIFQLRSRPSSLALPPVWPWRGKILKVVGRTKDWAISGGENLYLPSIESALLATGMFSEVYLTSIPDKKWGDRLQCILSPKDAALKNRILQQKSAKAKEIFFSALKKKFLLHQPAFAWPKDFYLLDEKANEALKKEVGSISRHKAPRKLLQAWCYAGRFIKIF